MNVSEAIRQRKSIRAFKREAVPREILTEIMGLSLRAPSWENTQPWEFDIVSGSKLEDIRTAYMENAEERPNAELAGPPKYDQPFDTRRRTLGMKVFEIEGINREDREKRKQWQLRGLRLFDAPCAIYIYIERSFYLQDDTLNIWPIFDCGLIAENIMLLAAEHGLGTIPQIQAVAYPSILRQVLGIPESKLIVLGIAIGYPDWDDPINQFESQRDPLETVARWHGFDQETY